MRKSYLWIRSFYWLGAILDARVGIILFIRRYLELPDFVRNSGSGAELLGALYGVGQACALMWGWTLLLLWADRKPLERRGIILLTIFPVVILLMINIAHIVSTGFDSASNQCLNIGIGSLLIVLGLYCYVAAGRIESEMNLVQSEVSAGAPDKSKL